MTNLRTLFIFLTALCCFLINAEAQAQLQNNEVAPLQRRVQELESKVARFDKKVQNAAESGVLLFFCGTFCALWAQNTGRSAWLWFFLGLFFHVITLIFLLIKNSQQRPPRGFNIQDYRQQ